VRHPETNRAYLWLEDLTRAFIDILTVSSLSSEPPRFAVYHLLSFNSKIGTLASAIAGRTSARIDTADHAPAPDSIGFSHNGSLFSRTFKTSMKGTPALVVADLDMHVPDSITAKGAHIQLSHIVEDGTDEKPSHDAIRSALVARTVCARVANREGLTNGQVVCCNNGIGTCHDDTSCEVSIVCIQRCSSGISVHLA
jgi:hypothetical protein